jgi:hypothetical protein
MKIKTRKLFRNRYGQTSNRRALVLATGLLSIIAASVVRAQDDLPFESGSTGTDGPLIVPPHPTARENPAMGYDSARGTLVMFGGSAVFSSSTYYPETWTSANPASGWEKISTDTFVSARSAAAMAWDATNNGLLLFGGERADGVELNDMWLWDGADWNAVGADTLPPARRHHSLVTDPLTGKIYLFGGRNGSNVDLNDLWTWDGTNWTEITDAGTPPNVSFGYSQARAAWDASDNALIVFNSSGSRTWKFKDGAWFELSIATPPSPGSEYTFHYNPATESCILHGGSTGSTSNPPQTWEFRDDEWIQLSPPTNSGRRYKHACAYHAGLSQLVITQGYLGSSTFNGASNVYDFNTYTYASGDWTLASGRVYQFDMSSRQSGIWNFTTVDVPSNIEVRFDQRNASNTPVVWLASENVVINGILRLDGEDAQDNEGADNYARGGPGGAAGGLGGIRWDVSGNYAGTPGQGAGGGAPGITASQYGSPGEFRGAYGNTLLLPLTGGSGGGGGASSDTANGGHGGGGGGVILIASSKDITVNGYINADGGEYKWSGTSYGGRGSGGGIKLMADRINGSGKLWARGGGNRTDNSGGRIRLEAFFRPLAANASPPATATAPTATPDFTDLPELRILTVDGESVVVPPSGNLQTPDVVFTSNGVVSIVVEATNVPVGTPVTLRITSSGEIINLPAPEDTDVVLNGSLQATFSTVVPAGLGTIQAFSEFTPEP